MIALAFAAVAVALVVMVGLIALADRSASSRVALVEAETVRGLTAQPEPSLLERYMRDDVVVTLKTGTGFRGVLFEFDDRVLVLRSAEARERDSTSPVAVDGDVVLRWVDVDFVQHP